VRSPESYLGYRQSAGFAQEGVARFDASARYAAPAHLALNTWALAGQWTVAGHAAVSDEAGGRLAFRFHARDVNLVMGPVAVDRPVRYRVFLDGETPDTAQGSDVDVDGRGTLTAQTTYQLIRQTGPVRERTFEIEFFDAGAEAYCLTFG
jgi:hypothetical protein